MTDKTACDETCIDCCPGAAHLGETMTVAPGVWTPLDDHGTEIYVYGDQAVGIAVQTAEVGDEIRRLRGEIDRLRHALAERS